LIGNQPGRYDFTSLEGLYESAEREGIEIILDLMHFGWPDFVDVFSPDFIAQWIQPSLSLNSSLTPDFLAHSKWAKIWMSPYFRGAIRRLNIYVAVSELLRQLQHLFQGNAISSE
jgi:hypothetical protein